MKAIIVIFVGVAALITATALSSRKHMPASSIKSNVRDFALYGLTVIPPSDRSFDTELTLILGGKNLEIRNLINSARPFSAVVKNSTSVDLVGCRIEWNIIKEDGTNIIEGQSYLNPDVLVGLEPIDNRLVGYTSLVNAQSSGIILLDAQANRFADARIKGTNAGTMPALSSDDKRNIEELSQQLTKGYHDVVKSAKQFTISLKSAIFSDGTFLGSDTDDLILNARALVDARHDLAKSIKRAINTNKSPAEILKHIESMARHTESSVESEGSPTRKYNHLYDRYKEVLVDELLDISRAGGGVNEAIKYTQRPLAKTWPALRKIESKTKG